jgi:RNA ligase (TIGR02306 family)
MENNNSVAFITKIKSITPIEGADKIELATCEGWTSVVQKGVHKTDDLVLCITTDAVIPDELAEKWNVKTYLRTRCQDPNTKFAKSILCVRTVKLKGVYSECILIPLVDVRPSLYSGLVNPGLDMMNILKIFKYEPPVRNLQLSNGRKIKYKSNLNFHIYHKFPNIKNKPSMFKDGELVSISTKYHGTNARYGIVKKSKLSLLDKIKRFFGNKLAEYEYVYGSHNVEKGSDTNGFYSTDVWKEVADKHNLKKLLWDYVKLFAEYDNLKNVGSGIILYGEIIGPQIQGEYTYNLKERDIIFFDVELDSKYVGDSSFEMIMNELEINTNNYIAPLFYNYNEDEIKKMATNIFIEGTKIPHEGLVVKSLDGDRSKIAKFINPDYLIYAEKHNVPDSH